MPDFTLQTVNPRGAVEQTISVPASDIIEAHALARRFAASLVDAGPEGKNWSGWSIEILDPFGRYSLSVPLPTSSRPRQTASLSDIAA
jgi:hypothetical protein